MGQESPQRRPGRLARRYSAGEGQPGWLRSNLRCRQIDGRECRASFAPKMMEETELGASWAYSQSNGGRLTDGQALEGRSGRVGTGRICPHDPRAGRVRNCVRKGYAMAASGRGFQPEQV